MPALYSVWDPQRRTYDYFEAAGDLPLGPPDPRHMRGKPALGMAPAKASWPLPLGARHVGRGAHARGKIAETAANRAMGDYGGGPPLALLAAGVAAFLFWRTVKRVTSAASPSRTAAASSSVHSARCPGWRTRAIWTNGTTGSATSLEAVAGARRWATSSTPSVAS